jgi:hypothetical protein
LLADPGKRKQIDRCLPIFGGCNGMTFCLSGEWSAAILLWQVVTGDLWRASQGKQF